MSESTPPEAGKATSQDRSASRRAWRSPIAILLFAIVFAGVLTSDLAMKQWSFAHVAGHPVTLPANYAGDPNAFIPMHAPTVLIPHVLNLQLTYNPGAVFGLGKGNQGLFIVVSIIASIVVIWIAARTPARSWAALMALALILAGALGNLYDRYQFGAVRDMFHLLPSTRLWPWIWNIADAALMIGVGIMFVSIWLSDRHPQTAAADHD